MKTTIRILAVVALVQIALIMTTWIGGSKLQNHTRGSQLLDFKTTEVDTFLIKDAKNEVQLKKKDNKWLLADGFPANQKKVAALLSKLSGLQYSLPVATSAQSLGRFKVATENFVRYLQLQGNKKTLAELYLGTGAGARQSHIRNGEQESVYSAAIGSYDLSVTQDSWQNKELLTFSKEDVTAIKLGEVKLHREPQTDKKETSPLWQGESLPHDTTINQKEINESLTKLADLRFTKVLGQKDLPEYGLSEPLFSVKLFFKNSDRIYSFGKIRDSEDICLKVSDRNEYFQLASYLAKPILEQIKKDIFVTNNASSSETATTTTKK